MAIGEPFKQVTNFLGLHEGSYHLIRRSNARPDVRLLFRTLRSGQSSIAFPQLDWLLKESGNVLVFCPTINFSFKVAVYLWHLDPDTVSARQNIRLCNSLQSATYNLGTLALLGGNKQSQLTFTTDKLSIGLDVKNFITVVIIEPSDVDDLLQKAGRVWRDLLAPPQEPKVVVYMTSGSVKKAAETVEKANLELANSGPAGKQGRRSKKASETKRPPKKQQTQAMEGAQAEDATLDFNLALLWMAKCKVTELDRQWGDHQYHSR